MKYIFLLLLLCLTSCATTKTRIMDPEEARMHDVQKAEGGGLYRSVNWEVRP